MGVRIALVSSCYNGPAKHHPWPWCLNQILILYYHPAAYAYTGINVVPATITITRGQRVRLCFCQWTREHRSLRRLLQHVRRCALRLVNLGRQNARGWRRVMGAPNALVSASNMWCKQSHASWLVGSQSVVIMVSIGPSIDVLISFFTISRLTSPIQAWQQLLLPHDSQVSNLIQAGP